MQSDILVNADPAVLHWIEFVAGTSNDIVLSRDKVVLAKAMLKEAEQHSLEKEESLEAGLRVERLRVALAPHKSVPAEILGIIFRYSSMILCVCTFALKYDPLTFSHVCSRWRTICRSEPSFWNRAFFLLGQRDDLNLIEFCMDNLVIDSLSLSIKGHSDFDPESLKLILSRHSLIRHLETQEVEHFLGMPIQSFPLLENLYISLDSRKFPLVFRSPCFVGMENLRNFTVRFSGPADESMLTQTTLPWGCLTSLTIRFRHKDYFLTIPQAVELLKQCTNLRKCSICVKNASAPSLLTVHLPHLTDLYFVPHLSVHENPFSLTYCLITPVLKSLTISVVMSKTFDDAPDS